jgi:hypothetical protein
MYHAAPNTPTGTASTTPVATAASTITASASSTQVAPAAPAPWHITTFAGTGDAEFPGDGGDATSAGISRPFTVVFDSVGSAYVSDVDNHRVRRVALNGVITTFAGTGVGAYAGDGGQATSAALNNPAGLSFDDSGSLYIVDRSNNVVRVVASGGVIGTLAGTGAPGYWGDGDAATSAALNAPWGVVLQAGSVLVADRGNHVVRRVAMDGTISTIAGTGEAGYCCDGEQATSAQLFNPYGVSVYMGAVYITDTDNHRVRRVDGSTGVITTFAGSSQWGDQGDGDAATAAQLFYPFSTTFDAGGSAYITDSANHRVRRVLPGGVIDTWAGNGVNTFAGDGGPATSASLHSPHSVTFDNGNAYIADADNNRVRIVYRAPLTSRSPSTSRTPARTRSPTATSTATPAGTPASTRVATASRTFGASPSVTATHTASSCRRPSCCRPPRWFLR